jgi:hypothetical protein
MSSDSKAVLISTVARAAAPHRVGYSFQFWPPNRTGLGIGFKELAKVAKARKSSGWRTGTRGGGLGALADAVPERVAGSLVGDHDDGHRLLGSGTAGRGG